MPNLSFSRSGSRDADDVGPADGPEAVHQGYAGVDLSGLPHQIVAYAVLLQVEGDANFAIVECAIVDKAEQGRRYHEQPMLRAITPP